MPQTDSLLRAWTETDYRVRLPRGGHAGIRVGGALPHELVAFLRGIDEPWGFVTAWNPRARAESRASNRTRQRALRDALLVAGYRFRAGIGVGGGWREPGLFVAGIDPAALDAIALRFDQAAVVRGVGRGRAELHVLS